MKTRHIPLLILPCLAQAQAVALQASQQEPAPAIQETQTEADALYERLVAEYEDANDKVNSAFDREAEGSKEGKGGETLHDLLDERNAVIAKFTEAAKTHARTEGAVPFLIWRVMLRPSSAAEAEAVSAALATIQKTHIKSAKLTDMLPALGSLDSRVSGPEAASFMTALAERSSVPELRAMGKYMGLLRELKSAKYGTDAYEKLSKATLAAAKATGEKRSVKDVEMAIEFASKFSVGMLAPNIEGIDLSGEAFKLSDYEGKVVFLDFWGDW